MTKKQQEEVLAKNLESISELEMNWRIRRAQELVAEQIRAEYRKDGMSKTWNDSNIDAAYRELAQNIQSQKDAMLKQAYRDMAKVK